MNTAMEMPSPERALEMYKELVENNDQAIPILLYGGEKAIMPIAMTDVQAGDMQGTLKKTLAAVVNVGGPARWVMFSAEGWMRVVPVEQIGSYVPGQLERAKELGDPDIVEVVTITAVSPDSAWGQTVVFERTENGVTWEEPIETKDMGGGVYDVMQNCTKWVGQ